MPRARNFVPKPWPRHVNGVFKGWYVTVNQKQQFLAPADATPEQVQQALGKVLMQLGVEEKKDEGPVVPLFNRYLLWVRDNQATETFKMRSKDIQSFVTYLN